jgi:DNA replication licensing factor MCM5
LALAPIKFGDRLKILLKMEGFDDPGIYYSDNFGSEEQANETAVNNQAIKKKFKDFIRQFHEGNFNYKYR